MNQENIAYTTFRFSLPIGLLDEQGGCHQEGVMRSTTGKDEIILQQDSRCWENPSYGLLVRLSQVIVSVGELTQITPELLEGLFLLDWQYLLNFYNSINPPEAALFLEGE